ncbi:MAG: hypothetical protein ACR2MI_03660 [Flavobacteriaceae bacterium]
MITTKSAAVIPLVGGFPAGTTVPRSIPRWLDNGAYNRLKVS